MKMGPPEVGPSIHLFEASVKNGTAAQRCTVSSYTRPLQCEINGLTGGKTPTVEVRSCVPGDSACSSAVEKAVILRMFFHAMSGLASRLVKM